MSTSWVIRLLRKLASIGLTIENELLASPIHRWLYSTPNDQFGVKPYSKPTPRVPPQRVALTEANSTLSKCSEEAVAIARHRRAALYVKQRCIPSVADLAGEEADTIGRGASGEKGGKGSLKADALPAEIRPIALRFQAKHPLTGLPTITDLAADDAPGPLAAAVSDGRAKSMHQRNPSSCCSDPSRRCRRCRSRSSRKSGPPSGGGCGRSQISSRGGSSHPERNQTGRPQQKLLHHSIPICHGS